MQLTMRSQLFIAFTLVVIQFISEGHALGDLHSLHEMGGQKRLEVLDDVVDAYGAQMDKLKVEEVRIGNIDTGEELGEADVVFEAWFGDKLSEVGQKREQELGEAKIGVIKAFFQKMAKDAGSKTNVAHFYLQKLRQKDEALFQPLHTAEVFDTATMMAEWAVLGYIPDIKSTQSVQEVADQHEARHKAHRAHYGLPAEQ